jgi:flavin reductase (DIM6/NTAB) family NADH-FMN oxidoreductase RutF
VAHVASGVSVLTTRDREGRDCVLTVTSLVSLSLEPPLVLVAVRRGGFIYDALRAADAWAVTILASTQVPLADYAARRRGLGGVDDFTEFAGVRGPMSGALYFPAGMTALECVPHQVTAAGTHLVAVAEVVGLPACHGEQPLLYHHRQYRAVGAGLPASGQ